MHQDMRCSAPVAVAFTVASLLAFAAMGAAVTAHLIDRLTGR